MADSDSERPPHAQSIIYLNNQQARHTGGPRASKTGYKDMERGGGGQKRAIDHLRQTLGGGHGGMAVRERDGGVIEVE